MIRLSQIEVEPFQSQTGEINCMKWRNIIFSWKSNTNNVDEYVAEGFFVGIHPKYMYETLTLKADFINKVFHLKTGHGKEITWVNLLGI